MCTPSLAALMTLVTCQPPCRYTSLSCTDGDVYSFEHGRCVEDCLVGCVLLVCLWAHAPELIGSENYQFPGELC